MESKFINLIKESLFLSSLIKKYVIIFYLYEIIYLNLHLYLSQYMYIDVFMIIYIEKCM